MKCFVAAIVKAALAAVAPFAIGPAHALTEAELRKFFEFGEPKLSLARPIPSWPKQELVYASIGDSSGDVNSLIADTMKTLSSATGLSIRRGYSGSVDITFIVDPTVLLDLHDKPQRFHTIGLKDDYIDMMRRTIPRPPGRGGENCAHQFSPNEDGDIVNALALSQSTSKSCIVSSALTVIGVRMDSLDQENESIRMACILYEARRLGIRTMADILDYSFQLESACRATRETK